MTITDFAGTEPAAIPVTNAEPPPRCQVLWQCPDKCLPATRCPDRAEYRVSFRCTTSSCDHAADMVLMCDRCAGQADVIGAVLARRPL